MDRPDDHPDAGASVRDALLDAVIGLDENRIRRIADEVADAQGHDALVADVLVPTLNRIGQMWHSGELSVMHEHFSSSIIRSIVAERRRTAHGTTRPRVILGCPPGELHDLPSHMFALMLVDRGMDPFVLGASTPVGAISHAAYAMNARACVITARRRRSLDAYRVALRRLSTNRTVFVAGPVTEQPRLDEALTFLPHDWREAADIVGARCVEDVAPGAAAVG